MNSKLTLLATAFSASLLIAGCQSNAATPSSTDESTSIKTEQVAAIQVVEFTTNIGNFTVELDAKAAPITVANFVEYVNAGFYSDVIFHRVIAGFMVQGGGFDVNFDKKPTNAAIKIESDNQLQNLRGTIAMARTSVPDSASSQFFVNLVDNEFLNYKSPSNPGYTVFGKVISGMDVIDAIAATPTTMRNGMRDVPQTDIIIQSASIVNE